jgi:chromosome segregation ATPase
MRQVGLALSFLALATALGGCQTGPASERGFFSGIGAAVSGEDERQAQTLEAEASAREARAQQLAVRAQQADRDAQTSSAQVRAAEQRLAALNADLQRQRNRLNALKASASGASSSEVNRLQTELNELDRDQRSARGGGISPAALRTLEDRARALNNALTKLGAV